MTYSGCFVIIAIIWCSIKLYHAIKRYIMIRKHCSQSHIKYEMLADIFLKPFYALFTTCIIWAFSLLFFALIGTHIPKETEYRTIINYDNQNVVFKEQTGNKHIVSVNGTEYTCKNVVFSDNISDVQVVFVDIKTADHFYAKFFFDELTGNYSFYELHIPTSKLSSS